MPKHYKLIIDEPLEGGKRLDGTLANHLDLSRTRIKQLILGGHVQVNNQIVRVPNHTLKFQDVVLLYQEDATEALPQAEEIPLEILYEDADVIVLNKPAGMVVHPAPGNRKGTLVNALLAHAQDSLSGIGGVKRPGIVHRLDKETSGLMVVAKNDAAHHNLSLQFQDRSLSRTYQAFVRGRPSPSQGTVSRPIGRSLRNRKKMGVRQQGGKEAVTHYKTLAYYGTKSTFASLVECTLQTGRTHQIRVHMAALGHPLLGDPLYGSASALDPILKRLFKENSGSYSLSRQALHAGRLSFLHPRSREALSFTAPLPEDMVQLRSLLEGFTKKETP